MSVPARILIGEYMPSQAELGRTQRAELKHKLKIARDAFGIAQAWRPDVILPDLERPDHSGAELMQQLRAACIRSAAIRESAVDIPVKPFHRARLTVTPNNGLTKRSLPAALRSLREKRADDRFFNFIGAAPAMQAVYKTIEAVSASIVALNGAGVVTVSTLPPVLLHQGPAAQDTADIGTMPLAEPEEHLMIQALQHTGNDVPRVAALLEADSSTIYRKLQSCRC